MDESCLVSTEKKILESDKEVHKDDVVQQNDARAIVKPIEAERRTKFNEGELPPKKRKTRRGKCKRRQQYLKNKNTRKSNKLIKPEAPRNSNQFLLEDHGLIEELDDNLKMSPSLRNRDSSFSVDSDGDFYSSPDDEQFLIKDFDDQYESLHAERLQTMSKNELIQEYLVLENKLEQLSKQLQDEDSEDRTDLKQQIERLTMENDQLKTENEILRNKNVTDSEDSETDSSSSCSSSTSSSSTCSSRSRSPLSHTGYDKKSDPLLSQSSETVNPIK